MGKILTVTHRNGSTFNLQCKGNEVWGITSATQSIELNGNDTATVAVLSTTPLPFALGDTIAIYGKVYTLNEPPKQTKTGERRYQYTCTFEGEQYKLLNPLWQMPFSAINDAYTGTLADFAALLVSNIVRIYGSGSWVVGNVPENTATKTLCYTDTNCLDVLQQICSEWEVEFTIGTNGNTHVLEFYPTIGGSIDHEFTYGLIGGGYELQRNGTSDPDFGTRIYFYGGSNNIPNSYFNSRQSPRLCLARKVVGTTQTSNPNKANSYIQQPNAVNLYGLIERVKVFEEIYPNRIGKVTAIDNDNERVFFDDTMFELDKKTGGNTDYLIAGTTAKVHFNTGLCAGYDFDIAAFTWKDDDGSIIGKFTINAITDENNYVFPSHDNNTFRIATGDEYIITDIVMPTAYVTAAQNELQTAAQGWYEKHCAPAIEYTMNLDQQFVKRLAADLGITDGVVFHIGDKIKITDAEMGFVQKEFRITKFTRDLTRAYAYTLEIAETDTHRAKYNWRRRTRAIPGLFERLGLTDVSRLAADANQAAISRQAFNLSGDNSTRIGLIVDDNGSLRPAIIQDSTIINRMVANNAITNNKIKAGDIAIDRLAQAVVKKIDRVDLIPTLLQYINNGSNLQRHYTGDISIENNILSLKTVGLVDGMARQLLGFPTDTWNNANDETIDFTTDREADKAYNVYAVVKDDGSMTYEALPVDESIVGDDYIKLGEVSAEDGEGKRTYTQSVGKTYMQDGVLRDETGNAVLDIQNNIIRGAVKFAGLKDANGNDIDMLSILGVSPTTAGGMRKMLSDNISVVGADANSGLRKKVADQENIIGADANSGLRKATSDLQTTVGNSNSGLVKSVNNNTAKIGTANTSGTLIYKINELIDSLTTFNTRWRTMQTAYNGLLDDLEGNGGISHAQKNNRQVGIQQCQIVDQIERCSATPQDMAILPGKFTN